jgi:hypothetical protein
VDWKSKFFWQISERKIIQWKTTNCLAIPLQHNYVGEERDAALITKTKKTKDNDSKIKELFHKKNPNYGQN